MFKIKHTKTFPNGKQITEMVKLPHSRPNGKLAWVTFKSKTKAEALEKIEELEKVINQRGPREIADQFEVVAA